MEDSAAFAIATQQSHKLKKSPKGYGTAEGRRTAKAKYTKPRKSYRIGADPKGLGKDLQKQLDKKAYLIDDKNPLTATRRERSATPFLIGGAVAGAIAGVQQSKDPETVAFGALSGALAMYLGSRMLSKPIVKEASMSDGYQMVKIAGFSDELQKISASVPGLGAKALSAAKKAIQGVGTNLAGGAKKKPGLFGRIAGKESTRPVKSITGVKEWKAAKPGSEKRKQIAKVIGTRAAVGTAATVGTVKGVKKHKKTERRQMGRAYVTGARDMYGHMGRRQR